MTDKYNPSSDNPPWVDQPMSTGDMFVAGWNVSEQSCPNCGGGLMSQARTLTYWCTRCCQKFNAFAFELDQRRGVMVMDTALEWLNKQISKYTRKKSQRSSFRRFL